MKRTIAALAALLAIAVVAGCGGGGSSTDSGSTTGGSTEGGSTETETTEGGSTEGQSGGEGSALSKAQFIAKADAICTASQEDLSTEVEKYAKEEGISENEKPSKEEEVAVIERFVLPNLETEAREIGDLPAPEGDEDRIETLLANLEKGNEEAEGDPESLLAGSTEPFETAAKEAGAYGMKVCGA